MKNIHLLGKGRGWEEIDEVKRDSENEIWSINDAMLRTGGVDKIFHMHDLQKFLEDKKTESSTKLMIDKANENSEVDFYTIYKYKKIPHSIEYPIGEVLEYFNIPIAYFSSGPEFMIAYAIMQEPTDLYYYGLNMSVKEEYILQKSGMEFWTGIAMGRGINVHLQLEHTSLLKTRDGLVYGYLINQWRVND